MLYSEDDTRVKLIDPKLHECGWEEEYLVRQYPITDDRFFVEGEEYKKIPTKKFADYVLKYRGVIVGVVEAKSNEEDPEKHLGQAQDYAKRLNVPFAYITNGNQIFLHDRRENKTQNVDSYLTPEEIYDAFLSWKGLKADSVSALEYSDYIGPKTPRSYQMTAVQSVVANIVRGEKHTLLTMATGTGKTYVAFQSVWKLIKSKHFSRVLFLADRIILRDQAFESFEPFRKGNVDDRWKIENQNFNKNRNIYFSTYQTLFTNNLYKQIPKDFFDLIIIDECHRSRFGDWGIVLDYFSSAYNLGMTATPKREDNIDVYEYFGQPVFEYSLAQAIDDGYLVPYKIYKVTTDLDKNGVDINQAEEVVYDDQIEPEKLKDFYQPSEFERSISIPDLTEKYCKKVIEILDKTNPDGKTIVFCEDMTHAQQVKDKFNEIKSDENYATRIVAEEKDDLTKFRDKEMRLPVVATTVDLLSTGVDIPHIENIVFMRPIGSTVLFKQIIGRGSRLSEGKGFFRIIDFKNATRLIDEWDIPKTPGTGDPDEVPIPPYNKIFFGSIFEDDSDEPVKGVEVKIKIGRWLKNSFTDDDGNFIIYGMPSNDLVKASFYRDGYKKVSKGIRPQENEEDDAFVLRLKKQTTKAQKIRIYGIDVTIEDEIEIEFEGRKLSFAEYKKVSKKELKNYVHTSQELKDVWLDPEKKNKFLHELEVKNINLNLIKTIDNLEDSDGFDIVMHLVFDAPLLTRDDRTKIFVRENIEEVSKYGTELRDAVFEILDKYKYGGEENLSSQIFMMPNMHQRKQIIQSQYPSGLSGFMHYIKDKIYA